MQVDLVLWGEVKRKEKCGPEYTDPVSQVGLGERKGKREKGKRKRDKRRLVMVGKNWLISWWANLYYST